VHRNKFLLDITVLYSEFSCKISVIIVAVLVVCANGFDIIAVCQEEVLLML
jgi:hypothetical protein